MRRLFQVRIPIVLLALALIPAATLPFAGRLRREWAKLWEPRPAEPMQPLIFADGYGSATPLFDSPPGAADARSGRREVILLRRPRLGLPTHAGTVDDYAEALADPRGTQEGLVRQQDAEAILPSTEARP